MTYVLKQVFIKRLGKDNLMKTVLKDPIDKELPNEIKFMDLLRNNEGTVKMKAYLNSENCYKIVLDESNQILLSSYILGNKLLPLHNEHMDIKKIIYNIINVYYSYAEKNIYIRDIRPKSIMIDINTKKVKVFNFQQAGYYKDNIRIDEFENFSPLVPEYYFGDYTTNDDLMLSWYLGALIYFIVEGKTLELDYDYYINFKSPKINTSFKDLEDLFNCLITNDINKRISIKDVMKHKFMIDNQ